MTNLETTTADINTDGLESLGMPALRQRAAVLRVPFDKTWTKDELVNGIREYAKTRKMANIVSDLSEGPAPGYARVTISRSTGVGSTNVPVPLLLNGVRLVIPRGVPCDIPIKFVQLLRDCKEKRLPDMKTDAGPSQGAVGLSSVMEEHDAYPFTVESINPGPDPMPGMEKGRAKLHELNMRCADEIGRWPTAKERREWIATGKVTY